MAFYWVALVAAETTRSASEVDFDSDVGGGGAGGESSSSSSSPCVGSALDGTRCVSGLDDAAFSVKWIAQLLNQIFQVLCMICQGRLLRLSIRLSIVCAGSVRSTRWSEGNPFGPAAEGGISWEGGGCFTFVNRCFNLVQQRWFVLYNSCYYLDEQVCCNRNLKYLLAGAGKSFSLPLTDGLPPCLDHPSTSSKHLTAGYAWFDALVCVPWSLACEARQLPCYPHPDRHASTRKIFRLESRGRTCSL